MLVLLINLSTVIQPARQGVPQIFSSPLEVWEEGCKKHDKKAAWRSRWVPFWDISSVVNFSGWAGHSWFKGLTVNWAHFFCWKIILKVNLSKRDRNQSQGCLEWIPPWPDNERLEMYADARFWMNYDWCRMMKRVMMMMTMITMGRAPMMITKICCMMIHPGINTYTYILYIYKHIQVQWHKQSLKLTNFHYTNWLLDYISVFSILLARKELGGDAQFETGGAWSHYGRVSVGYRYPPGPENRLTKRERISEPPLFRGFICYKESLPRYLQIHRIDFGLLEEDLWVSWD